MTGDSVTGDSVTGDSVTGDSVTGDSMIARASQSDPPIQITSPAIQITRPAFQIVGPRIQIAFITGQSDPPRCALAPDQHRFLDTLPASEDERVRCNFPYGEAIGEQPPIPLWRASVNNTHQYVRSRAISFASTYRPRVLELLSRADRTLLLAGSCGIELLNNLHLPESVLHSVFVFAYGPVARRRPACRHVLVGSRGDRISRAWFPAPDVWVDAGHLGYLENDAVLAHCRALLDRVRTER